MKVLIVAGGTAGHTLPAITVAEHLRKKEEESEILFITSRKKQDKTLIFNKGFKSYSIFCGKFRRYFSLFNLIDPFFVLLGFLQSFLYILKFRPNVIFSKGGYVSLPAVFAGRILGRKILIHESDAIMGLANKISSYFANRVAVSFPIENFEKIKKDKLVFTGNPTKDIKMTEKRLSGSTVFISGGSQGSRKINDCLVEILPDLLLQMNVIHITGKDDYLKVKEATKNINGQYKYKVFSQAFEDNDYSRLISEADIIVSRAGASSIFEAALVGLSLILIPLSGHQEKNAEVLEEKKAAIVIKNSELNKDNFRQTIISLMENQGQRKSLSLNISEFAPKDASEKIVKELKKISK